MTPIHVNTVAQHFKNYWCRLKGGASARCGLSKANREAR